MSSSYNTQIVGNLICNSITTNTTLNVLSGINMNGSNITNAGSVALATLTEATVGGGITLSGIGVGVAVNMLGVDAGGKIVYAAGGGIPDPLSLNTLNVNTINERTASAGVTISHKLILSSVATGTAVDILAIDAFNQVIRPSSFAISSILVDSIGERTLGAGVIISNTLTTSLGADMILAPNGVGAINIYSPKFTSVGASGAGDYLLRMNSATGRVTYSNNGTYVDSINQLLSTVASPTFADVNITSLSTQVLGADTSVLRQIGGLDSEINIDVGGINGIAVNSVANVGYTYDVGTYKFTVNYSTANVRFYNRGKLYIKTAGTSEFVTHTNTTAHYYIYFDNGTLTIATGTIDFSNYTYVAHLYYNSNTVDDGYWGTSPKGIVSDMRFAMKMTNGARKVLHEQVGVYGYSGLTISGITLNDDTDNTKLRYDISASDIYCEDLLVSISALPVDPGFGNVYTCLYRYGSAGEWRWFSSKLPYIVNGIPGSIVFNSVSGTTWSLATPTSTEGYINIYLIAGTNGGYMFIVGQNFFTTTIAADNDTIWDQDLANFPCEDFISMYKITCHYKNTYNADVGSVQYLAYTKITVNETYITQHAAITEHNTLGGRNTVNGHPISAINGTTQYAIPYEKNDLSGLMDSSALTFNGTTLGLVGLLSATQTGTSSANMLSAINTDTTTSKTIGAKIGVGTGYTLLNYYFDNGGASGCYAELSNGTSSLKLLGTGSSSLTTLDLGVTGTITTTGGLLSNSLSERTLGSGVQLGATLGLRGADYGVDIYVDVHYSGAITNGTRTNPYKSISAALSSIASVPDGDVRLYNTQMIHVAAGIYDEAIIVPATCTIYPIVLVAHGPVIIGLPVQTGIGGTEFNSWATTRNITYVEDTAYLQRPLRCTFSLISDNIEETGNYHQVYGKSGFRISGNIYFGSTHPLSTIKEVHLQNCYVDGNIGINSGNGNCGEYNVYMHGCDIVGNVAFPYVASGDYGQFALAEVSHCNFTGTIIADTFGNTRFSNFANNVTFRTSNSLLAPPITWTSCKFGAIVTASAGSTTFNVDTQTRSLSSAITLSGITWTEIVNNKGELVTYDGTAKKQTVLSPGTNGQFLVANSATDLGLSWSSTISLTTISRGVTNDSLFITGGTTSADANIRLYGSTHATYPGKLVLEGTSIAFGPVSDGTPIYASMSSSGLTLGNVTLDGNNYALNVTSTGTSLDMFSRFYAPSVADGYGYGLSVGKSDTVCGTIYRYYDVNPALGYFSIFMPGGGDISIMQDKILFDAVPIYEFSDATSQNVTIRNALQTGFTKLISGTGYDPYVLLNGSLKIGDGGTAVLGATTWTVQTLGASPSTILTISASGINAGASIVYAMNGTTVIDASRNIINILTAAIGNLYLSGNTLSTNVVNGDISIAPNGTGALNLTFGHTANTTVIKAYAASLATLNYTQMELGRSASLCGILRYYYDSGTAANQYLLVGDSGLNAYASFSKGGIAKLAYTTALYANSTQILDASLNMTNILSAAIGNFNISANTIATTSGAITLSPFTNVVTTGNLSLNNSTNTLTISSGGTVINYPQTTSTVLSKKYAASMASANYSQFNYGVSDSVCGLLRHYNHSTANSQYFLIGEVAEAATITMYHSGTLDLHCTSLTLNGAPFIGSTGDLDGITSISFPNNAQNIIANTNVTGTATELALLGGPTLGSTGSSLSLFHSSHATNANKCFINADTTLIRSMNTGTTYLTIDSTGATASTDLKITGMGTTMLPSETSVKNQVIEVGNLSADNLNGFYGTSPPLSYDYSTQTLTITAPFTYYSAGVKYVIAVNATKTHTNANGGYYFYYTGATLNSAASAPNIATNVIVAYVVYNSDGASTYWAGPAGMLFNEKHASNLRSNLHKYLHYGLGTALVTRTGGTMSTTYDNSTLANLTPTITTATIMDEDLESVIAQLTTNVGVGNQYTIYYNNAGLWKYYTTNVMFLHNGTNPVYVNPTTGAVTAITGNGEFFNVYVIATNWIAESSSATPTTKAGFAFICAQTSYATKLLAMAETLSSLNLTNFHLEETAPLYQITYERKNTYTAYYTAITALTRITNQKINVNQSSTTVHNSLSGRTDPSCHPIGAITGTTAYAIPFQNAGNTALSDSANFTWNGTLLSMSTSSTFSTYTPFMTYYAPSMTAGYMHFSFGKDDAHCGRLDYINATANSTVTLANTEVGGAGIVLHAGGKVDLYSFVHLPDAVTGTVIPGGVLGLDVDGQIVKHTVALTNIAGGAANQIFYSNGTNPTSSSTFTYNGTIISLGASGSGISFTADGDHEIKCTNGLASSLSLMSGQTIDDGAGIKLYNSASGVGYSENAFYNATKHTFSSVDSLIDYLILENGATKFYQPIQMQGSTIIDASRNISNIGTIGNSGTITNAGSSANLDFTDNSIHTIKTSADGAATNLLVTSGSSGTNGAAIDMFGKNFTGKESHMYFHGANYVFQSQDTLTTFLTITSSVHNSTVAYQMGGTTVIDTSRNISNVGTIGNSGTITDAGSSADLVFSHNSAHIIKTSGDGASTKLGLYSGSAVGNGASIDMFGSSYTGLSSYMYLHATKYTFQSQDGLTDFLTIENNSVVSQNGSWVPSKIELKENIVDIDSKINTDVIYDLKPKAYNYLNQKCTTSFGFIVNDIDDMGKDGGDGRLLADTILNYKAYEKKSSNSSNSSNKGDEVLVDHNTNGRTYTFKNGTKYTFGPKDTDTIHDTLIWCPETIGPMEIIPMLVSIVKKQNKRIEALEKAIKQTHSTS